MQTVATRHNRVLRNLLLAALAAAAVLFLTVAACNVAVLAAAAPHLHDVEQAPQRYTVIVLGARVHASGRLSDMLADRVATALDLYRAGKAERFLLSGDHGRPQYDEVNAMKDVLLAEGVPAEDIFLDHAGFDTYDSMYRAREIFQVDSALVVTQGFHVSRAVYIARALGIDAAGVEADRQPYLGAFRNGTRETLARTKAVINVLLRAKPRYLGEAIPITGDSRASWDR